MHSASFLPELALHTDIPLIKALSSCLSSRINLHHDVESLVQSSFKLTSLYSLHISDVLDKIDFSLSLRKIMYDFTYMTLLP